MLDPNPQGDGVGRWDIWEVISHAGGALVSGIDPEHNYGSWGPEPNSTQTHPRTQVRHTHQEPIRMSYTHTQAQCLRTQCRTQHEHTRTQNLPGAHMPQIQITCTLIPKTQHRRTPQKGTHTFQTQHGHTHTREPNAGTHTLQDPARQQTPQK